MTPNLENKVYYLDIKKFLIQANWDNHDFPIVARFLTQGKWKVTDDMLTPISKDN